MKASQSVEGNKLIWVKKELDGLLKDARLALQDYIEEDHDVYRLDEVVALLRQASGTLQMVEVKGAAILSREIVDLTVALKAGKVEQRDEAFEQLLGSVMKLQDYLDHVEAGNRDVPVVLLPILNDMRSARGADPMTGKVLFFPELADVDPEIDTGSIGDVRGDLPALRQAFQVGLLGWFKGYDAKGNLARMLTVTARLYRDVATAAARRLWAASSALIEALALNGLEASVTVKNLLGRVDREIKQLIDAGEVEIGGEQHEDLLKNLLYYVAQAEDRGRFVSAIKTQFSLNQVLPDERELEKVRERLSGPGVEVLAAVSDAVREDLAEVKDNLEIFLAHGQKNTGELDAVIMRLHRIADTLGMLGLETARDKVMNQADIVNRIVSGESDSSEIAIMNMATVVINVESALDDYVSFRPSQGEADDSAFSTGVLPFAEVLKLRETLVGEVLQDFEVIKEAIIEYISAPDQHQRLNDVPALLNSLSGALVMANAQAAAPLMKSIRDYVNERILQGEEIPDPLALEHLADAVSSAEYFVESLKKQGRSIDAILEPGEIGMARLGYPVRSAAPRVHEAEESATDLSSGLIEALDDIANLAEEAGETVVFRPAAVDNDLLVQAQEPFAGEPAVAGAPGDEYRDLVVLEEGADEEILEIFLEEADEVVGQVVELFPQWRRNTDDSETMVTIRRMFHTLKGSGRMIGAGVIAEFSWAFENLINRVLDNTAAPGPELLEVLADAVEVFPQLVEQIKGRGKPDKDVFYMMAVAHALSRPGTPVPERAAVTVAEETETRAEVPPQAEKTWETLEEVLGTEAMDLGESQVEIPEPAAAEEAEPVGSKAKGEKGKTKARGKSEPIVEVPEAGAEKVEVTEADESAFDTELLDIFLTEATQHQRDFDSLVQASARQRARLPLSDELLRAVHTLNGSARATGVPAIHELCSPLEAYLQARRQTYSTVDESAFELVAATAAEVGRVLALLKENPVGVPVDEELRIRIDTMAEEMIRSQEAVVAPPSEEAVEPRLAEAVAPPLEEKEVLTGIEVPEEAVVPAAAAPGVWDMPGEQDQELAELFLEEANDVMEAGDRALQTWSANTADREAVTELQRQLHTLKGGARMAGYPKSIGDLSHALESMVIKVSEGRLSGSREMFDMMHRSFDRISDMLDQARRHQPVHADTTLIAEIAALRGETELAEVQGPMPDKPSEQDQELAELFLEEAADLMEAGDRALNTWAENIDDRDAVTELQRQLHTLKGSARMASYPRSIGELSHSLESMIVEVVEGRLSGNSEMFGLLHGAFDAIGDMLDQARQGQPVYPATGMIEEIARLRGEEPAPEVEVAPALAEAPALAVAGVPKQPAAPQEVIRVKSDLLDNLVNNAGEVNIYHSRLEQQILSFGFNLGELEQTVERLRRQLRQVDIATEAQILYRYDRDPGKSAHGEDFDPLEMDRYSMLQQLSRSLGESVNDLVSIKDMLRDVVRDSEKLLLQQSRVSTDLQEGLMRTRMVQFAGLAPRLRRVARQTAHELGKKVDVHIMGETNELDRSVLDRMVAPLEHMIRNSISHGLELPEKRRQSGKPETGNIRIGIDRDGAEVVVRVADDGAGIDLEAVRTKAYKQGLIGDSDKLSNHDVMQLILESGFSTAGEVTQIAGRGVGMDVVVSEIKQLNGNLGIDSTRGVGTVFTVRLPFTLAINQALLVQLGEDVFAVPLTSIEGIVSVSAEDLSDRYEQEGAIYEYAGNAYELKYLGTVLGLSQPDLHDRSRMYPVLLVRSGDFRAGLQIDGLMGNREIVVKPLGPQISKARGISGATILGDGRVVLILDVTGLVRVGAGVNFDYTTERPPVVSTVQTIMVIDDSITIRKVTSRMLERNNFVVMSAKDGVDAVNQLQEQKPDLMLMDIEMPRMDGYELATHVRNNPDLKDIPIIMITSRTGQKHRQRAENIGVNKYLGKPYQESDLLGSIREFL
ncbi:MAG: Hpt domain-containing protein [Gammaproteobacteria bacterium]|jgi:chemosensory pili system protein ChpA (sensor histidine kinase/response regulator)|nr:Hpt domain-containing protein [Gammaproteobacteria bacterium]